MEQHYWNKVSDYGNPHKAGVYDVILIYDETKTEPADETYVSYKDLVPTGRKIAVRESRYFADFSHAPGWQMRDQPKEGMVWFEETGSYPNEKVYAWMPQRDFPDIDLPEGVVWEEKTDA